jgi:hypothetical protein
MTISADNLLLTGKSTGQPKEEGFNECRTGFFSNERSGYG